jgi:hypothetical protein
VDAPGELEAAASVGVACSIHTHFPDLGPYPGDFGTEASRRYASGRFPPFEELFHLIFTVRPRNLMRYDPAQVRSTEYDHVVEAVPLQTSRPVKPSDFGRICVGN